MNGVKILVAFHKKYRHSTSPAFLNMHVGREMARESIGFVGDNTGKNISSLNPYFCELTGLYWALHNAQLADVTGLCHYRRYFNVSPSWLQSTRKENKVSSGRFNFDKLNSYPAVLTKVLQSVDIVLAKKTQLKKSIEAHYLDSHIIEEWNTMLAVLDELYPAYKASEFFRTTEFMHEFNMFVSKKALTEKYLEWLFEILFEVYKRITPSNDPYQKRSIGFLSERLLNLYVYRNNFKVKEFPVFYLKD